MQKKSTARISAICVSCRSIPLLFFTLLSILTFTNLYAQPVRVTGVVRDGSGATVNGASINVKGTPVGTATDSSGRYSISVPGPSSVLVFSSVGFGTIEQPVGAKKVINVTLNSSASNLDEVVVIGYGQTQRKRDVAGAISSVSNKQIQERQPINLYDALQGQAAGVLIMNDNGEPGAEGSIQIRGANTFTTGGNTPLYVVDGVITDNASAINPNDIERVEILKDAASASIYGARSAAGVILITTKKGKEGKPRLDLQYSKVYGWLAHKIQAANASELRLYRKIQNGNLNGNQNAPINVNDRLDDRTAGYIATNGFVHVFDKSIPPFRYSYP
jgi:TonB-dependent starch-binding outer membrane protein SusC